MVLLIKVEFDIHKKNGNLPAAVRKKD